MNPKRKQTPSTKKKSSSYSASPAKTRTELTLHDALLRRNAELKARLEETREILHAIKGGEVDALFLDGHVYSLQGAETPYRILVESMNEGAATLAADGIILYCNRRFSTLLGVPLKELIGSKLRQYVQRSEWRSFDALMAQGNRGLSKGECVFETREGESKTIQCSFSPFSSEGSDTLCLVATDMTDRKLAENARFGSMLSSIGDAVIATDLEGRITFMNHVAEELTGWTLVEANMRPAAEVFDVIKERTRDGVESPIKEVLTTGKLARLEDHVLLIRKDRTEVAIDDSAAPIVSQTGKMMGVVLVFRDVTERREKDRAFRENQALLHAVIQGVPDPIYMKDREGRMVMANPATLAVIGKPPESILGKTDAEFYDDPEVGKPIHEADCRIMNSGQAEVLEEIGLTPLGYRSFLSTKSPWRDADGIIVGLLGISRDITERKQMEEKLVRSESEYRMLFELNPQPMWMVDRETYQFLSVNEAALTQYGYTKEEFLGLRLFDIVHPGDHPEIMRWYGSPATSLAHPAVHTHVRKNGSAIKVETITRDTKFEGKNVRLMQGQDVTRRLQAEEALLENLKLFQAFVESSLEPSMMIDERGTILAASQPGIALLCSSHTELVGQNVLRFIPSEQLPILERSYDTLLREPLRPRIAVVRMRLLDGSSVWVEAVCSMLRVDDRIGGYIVGLKKLEVGVTNLV